MKIFGFLGEEKINDITIVRGIAVSIMVLSHTIAFLHDDSNTFLNFLRLIGDIFAFSTFLFISGQVHYISFKNSGFKIKTQRYIRILEILIIFYILALFPYLKEGLGSLQNHLLNVLMFKDLPNFTEFLIPFIFYRLIFYTFPSLLKLLCSKAYIVIIVSLLCLISSKYLYNLNLRDYNFIKALFTGSDGLYRYPIISYFPVFLAGAYFEKIQLAKGWLFEISVIILSAVSLFISHLKRWPPSLSFISIGILFPLMLIELKNYYRNGFFNFLGKYSLIIVLFHILILHLIDIFTYKTYNNLGLIFIIYLVILLFSVMLVQICNVIQKAVFQKFIT